MAELKKVSPLLDNFLVGEAISQHNGVSCYPAMAEDSGNKYILKVITEPSSPAKLEALLLSGAYADAEGAMQYFRELSDDIISEAQILQKLAKLEGFSAFEAWQQELHEDGKGIDVYLLSPYKTTLQRQLQRNTMTHLNALNLGIDLSSALSSCRRCGFLYVDLRPGNIFLADNGQYVLGDLGFMRLSSLKYASLPEKYRSAYTAPEITDAFSCVSENADVYALGLVLYQVYNGGALPFAADNAPAEIFDPPMYADYEMAEIIAKACHPDPAERWQTPAELGQALVSYMQRNGANDDPIIPAAIPVEAPDTADETEGDTTEADATADKATVADDEAAASSDESDKPKDADSKNTGDQLSFLDDTDDDTAPSGDDANVDYSEVSGEVSDILEQVDELLAHDAPPPVIPPQPIDVPVPAPLYVSGETDGEEEKLANSAGDSAPDGANPDDDADSDEATAAVAAVPVDGDTDAETNDKETSEDEDENSDADEDEEADAVSEEDEEYLQPKRSSVGKLILRIAILLILLAGLVFGGIYLYQNIYLQKIDKLEIVGSEDTLQVHITSEIPDEKLTVVCSDLYGNQLPSPVVDGVASFTELAADKSYTVSVVIDGFHQLIGQTSAQYQTPAITEISDLTALTGITDCSVVLNFMVNGPDSEKWNVTYSASGETSNTLEFTGHNVTIDGLTLDKEYTFQISPVKDLYLSGTTEVVCVARKSIQAENLVITGCANGELSACWEVPADAEVDAWIVRYICNDGSQGTQRVTEPCVTFTGLDTSLGYSVEVTAEYMSAGIRETVMAGAITVSDLQVKHEDTALVLTWMASTQISQDGWRVIYTIDGSEEMYVLQTAENSVTLENAVPEALYTFRLEAVDNTQILGGKIDYTVAKPGNFQDYGTASRNMSFSMCKRPNKSNWSRKDLIVSDYTTQFKAGAKAGFVVRIRGTYNVSRNNVDLLYVIRSEDGSFYSVNADSSRWSDLWSKGYGELDIPALPNSAGSYNIAVYFDGAYVADVDFTIVD